MNVFKDFACLLIMFGTVAWIARVRLPEATQLNASRDQANISAVFAECASLLGLPKWDASNRPRSSSVDDLVQMWQSAGCTVSLFPIGNYEDGLTPLSLPVLIALNDDQNWCAIVGWRNTEEECYLLSKDDPKGRLCKWDDLYGRIKSPIVSISFPSSETLQPRIWIPGGKFDLGGINGRVVNTKTFALFNPGKSDIRVIRQEFSCGCAKAKLADEIIPPLGFCNMELKIDVSKTKSKNIDVKWLCVTDPPVSTNVFPVVGQVVVPMHFAPDYFTLGNVDPTEAVQELTATLIAPKSKTGQVSIVPVHLDTGLKAKDIDVSQGEPNVHLSINAFEASRDSTGYFQVEGIFAVDDGSERRLMVIGAAGRLRPWISTNPTIVNVGTVSPGDECERSVEFVTNVKGSAEVNAMHPNYVNARIEKNKVLLRVTAPTEPKVFRTVVLLRVGAESVNIPIVGQLLPNESVN